MPIYEYRCDNCGKELEAVQKFSDPHLVDCPSCGAPQLKRLLSQSSFSLKGGGWYADGYGGGQKKDSGSSSSSASSSESSASASSSKDSNSSSNAGSSSSDSSSSASSKASTS